MISQRIFQPQVTRFLFKLFSRKQSVGAEISQLKVSEGGQFFAGSLAMDNTVDLQGARDKPISMSSLGARKFRWFRMPRRVICRQSSLPKSNMSM